MGDAQKLNNESKEIEKELEKEDLENLGTLAIRIQKFIKNIENIEENNKLSKELKEKASVFNKEIIRLSNLRLKKKKEVEEDLVKSRLKTESPYNECSNKEEIPDGDFFSQKTQKVNNILVGAIDVLESVRRQGKYIDRTNSRIKSGLLKLGVSRNLVEEIDRRYLADYRIFVSGFILVLVLILLLRFWFK